MKNLIFLALAFIGLHSCDKDRDKNVNSKILPEATQSGKNTAGALVDGEVWVATTEFVYPDGTFCEKFGNYYDIRLDFRKLNRNLNNRIYIRTQIENLELNKEYILSRSENTDNDVSIYNNENNYYYTELPNNIGKLKISRLDLQNQIVCGTFEFKAVDKNGKVVNITEGRFDKKFD